MTNKPWYVINEINKIDSPALIVYRDRVEQNIETLINSIDDLNRLRPHIKTHKSPEVSKMFISKGITKFKCATIPEAEILATAGAEDVLLAYQPVGPKAERLLELVIRFPKVAFSCLIDNVATAHHLSRLFSNKDLTLDYYIDVNVGMNRTGIVPEKVAALVTQLMAMPSIKLRGLHAYDGHIRDKDFAERCRQCDLSFEKVEAVRKDLESVLQQTLTIVAGGTPTFPVHARRKQVECSPGTFIYWDKGYESILPEQTYLHAAVVVTRVISKPTPGVICIDLGHKSIASENPVDKRVYFINMPDLEPIGQSEEHMVLKTSGSHDFEIGDVLYGIPYHVCPTIALYERTIVITDHKVSDFWMTLSRNKKISI